VITQWNDNEDHALQGCSLLAQIIYLRGIRRHMNYQTGIAGNPKVRKLSLSGLADIARFEPDWGSRKPAWSASKEEVRAALEELKRSGLIQDSGSSLKDGLIFFLPLADANKSVQKRNPTGTPQEPHNSEPHEEMSNGAGSVDRNPTRNPTDEKPRNPTHQITDIQEEEKELPNGSSKKKTDKGHRLPDGWWPSAEAQAWAMVKLAWDEQRISYVTEGFVDYWRSVPGAKGRKTDWDATWRNWARRENEKSPATVAGAKPGFTDRNQRGNYGPERPKSKSDQFDDFIRGVKAGLEAGDDDVRGAVNNLRGSLPWPVDERREQGSCINAVGERIVPIRTGKP
jgi:hypothetical protein